MDDLERLQTMFPSVEGDVVAIVFNEYKNDGESEWVGGGFLVEGGS